MNKIIRKSNFTKWLAYSYPYIAQIIMNIISWFFCDIINMPLTPKDETTLFILINSFAILLGVRALSSYTHIDNCRNYKPFSKS